MVPKNFYENALFFSTFESSISDKDNLYFHVTQEIFSEANIEEDVESIQPKSCSYDFDSFLVKTKKNVFLMKISFDDQNFFINNESEFLKNNKHFMLPEYVSSGSIRIGENIKYLIYRYDVGVFLDDIGRLFLHKNKYTFLSCLRMLERRKTNTSFFEYSDFILENYDLDSMKDISKQSIYPVYKEEKIKRITEPIKEHLKLLYDSPFLKEKSFCHGNLNINNITTNGTLFKFFDFESCFMGNKFLDPCFLSLNLSFNSLMFNEFMKMFCEVNGIDYNLSKEEFRHCLSIASCIFLYKKLTELLIEQCVYENQREDVVVSIIHSLDSSKWCFERLPFYEDIKKDFSEIYESPTRILD
jgi:uncharacterized protein YpiB (UPF0302 family)